MELIDYTNNWVKGEVFQGRIMVALGVILLIGFIAVWKSEHESLRGMLIPMALMLVIFLGYGGMQMFVRPNHTANLEQIVEQQSMADAIKHEKEYLAGGDKAYTLLKKVWPLLIILSVVLYYVFTSEYLKGLSIGLIALFLTLIVLDTTLHYRLKIYLEGLNSL